MRLYVVTPEGSLPPNLSVLVDRVLATPPAELPWLLTECLPAEQGPTGAEQVRLAALTRVRRQIAELLDRRDVLVRAAELLLMPAGGRG